MHGVANKTRYSSPIDIRYAYYILISNIGVSGIVRFVMFRALLIVVF